MIVLGILLNIDAGTIEFLSPEFVDLLDLVLEISILLLTEHILNLVVKIFLPILDINLEGIPE